jgi:hypothetical protein
VTGSKRNLEIIKKRDVEPEPNRTCVRIGCWMYVRDVHVMASAKLRKIRLLYSDAGDSSRSGHAEHAFWEGKWDRMQKVV